MLSSITFCVAGTIAMYRLWMANIEIQLRVQIMLVLTIDRIYQRELNLVYPSSSYEFYGNLNIFIFTLFKLINTKTSVVYKNDKSVRILIFVYTHGCLFADVLLFFLHRNYLSFVVHILKINFCIIISWLTQLSIRMHVCKNECRYSPWFLCDQNS